MLLSYLRLVLFAAGLLIGVQVPGFINDYAKRVEAHLIEAQAGLSGFQNTANQFFKGDMQALDAHYRARDDPMFRSDADNLGNSLARHEALDKQFLAMQGAADGTSQGAKGAVGQADQTTGPVQSQAGGEQVAVVGHRQDGAVAFNNQVGQAVQAAGLVAGKRQPAGEDEVADRHMARVRGIKRNRSRLDRRERSRRPPGQGH